MAEYRAAPQVLRVVVNLRDHDIRAIWQEIHVWEVRAQHQQQIGILAGVVASAIAQQARHADIIGVVILNNFFTAQRVPNGGVQMGR